MRRRNTESLPMPERLPMSKKQKVAAVIVCVALACAVVAAGYAIKSRLTERKSGFSSAQEAAQAWFHAYQETDYKAELACYPKELQDYLLKQAGSQEAYAASFEAMARYAYADTQVTLGSSNPAGKDVTEDVERARQKAGLTLKIDEIETVSFTYTSDTLTVSSQDGDDSSTFVTCIRIGGSWYVFVD